MHEFLLYYKTSALINILHLKMKYVKKKIKTKVWFYSDSDLYKKLKLKMTVFGRKGNQVTYK